MAQGVWRYLGTDGKEYPDADDAQKYGGGLKAKRWHSPVKEWQPVYEDIAKEDAPVQVVSQSQTTPQTTTVTIAQATVPIVTTPVQAAQDAANSLAFSEYDSLDIMQLKENLRQKGYIIRGNPKRETLLEKLKGHQSV